MTHSRRAYTAVLSANDAFKLKYPRYLKGALLAALALTALIVWLWPGYQPQPYKLRVKEEMVWVDVNEPVDVPDPPRVPAAPVLNRPIEAAPINDPDLITDPVLPGFWDPPAPSLPDPSAYEDFVASSTLPKLQFQAKADYPEIARRSGLEGLVIVNARVDVNGRVERALVIQSVHPILDRAASEAAAKCRFTPAKQRERKVATWVAIPYRFKLR